MIKKLSLFLLITFNLFSAENSKSIPFIIIIKKVVDNYVRYERRIAESINSIFFETIRVTKFAKVSLHDDSCSVSFSYQAFSGEQKKNLQAPEWATFEVTRVDGKIINENYAKKLFDEIEEQFNRFMPTMTQYTSSEARSNYKIYSQDNNKLMGTEIIK